MKKALAFAIAAVMPFMIAGALLTPRGVTVSAPWCDPGADSAASSHEHLTPATVPGEEDDEGSTDLQGNPVSDAVAKYKFDAAGSLYELHSPQTELPRLGSPKS